VGKDHVRLRQRDAHARKLIKGGSDGES
jgi:hypothetical protein